MFRLVLCMQSSLVTLCISSQIQPWERPPLLMNPQMRPGIRQGVPNMQMQRGGPPNMGRPQLPLVSLPGGMPDRPNALLGNPPNVGGFPRLPLGNVGLVSSLNRFCF